MSSILRSYARNAAKNNMIRKGMKRICSRSSRGYFAANWRDWVKVKKGI